MPWTKLIRVKELSVLQSYGCECFYWDAFSVPMRAWLHYFKRVQKKWDSYTLEWLSSTYEIANHLKMLFWGFWLRMKKSILNCLFRKVCNPSLRSSVLHIVTCWNHHLSTRESNHLNLICVAAQWSSCYHYCLPVRKSWVWILSRNFLPGFCMFVLCMYWFLGNSASLHSPNIYMCRVIWSRACISMVVLPCDGCVTSLGCTMSLATWPLPPTHLSGPVWINKTSSAPKNTREVIINLERSTLHYLVDCRIGFGN